MLLHPEIPKCSDCQKWVYDKDWKQTIWRGEPLARDPKQLPPCWKCPKAMGTGKPNPGAELSAKNWRAWWYYRKCKADTTGLLARDAQTLENAALIQLVEEQAAQHESTLIPLTVLAQVFGGRK